jgi:hypothetical protein
VDRAEATAILDRLDTAQNEFYGAGNDTLLRALLDPDITWTVPNSSSIAGTYRGLKQVFAYFTDRRNRATGTFRMHRRDVLAGEGTASRPRPTARPRSPGTEHRWSTVGRYDISPNRQIAACRLLPLNQPGARFPRTAGGRMQAVSCSR